MECPICSLKIEKNDIIKLKCNHTFHKFCLCESYKIDKSRQCPYCRNPYSPVQLYPGEMFVKGFHKQNLINKHTCNAILQSGLRKGETCNVVISNNMCFCKRHSQNELKIKMINNI